MLTFLKYWGHINIDPEEIWNLLIELGSFAKVSANLSGRGIVNLKNGEPFTSFVLQRTTWRWLILNSDKAYKVLKEKVPSVTEEYWEQFLVSKAYSIFITVNHNRKHFQEWCKQMDLEKYADYRKSKYFN